MIESAGDPAVDPPVSHGGNLPVDPLVEVDLSKIFGVCQ